MAEIDWPFSRNTASCFPSSRVTHEMMPSLMIQENPYILFAQQLSCPPLVLPTGWSIATVSQHGSWTDFGLTNQEANHSKVC